VIAITQNGVIVGTATVVNGQAVVALIGFDATLPLMVTATAQNYTPYQGTVATTMSTGSFALSTLHLYPNPAGAQLTVSHNLEGVQASYKIYDVTGKHIFTGNVPAGTSFGVDTSRYASGVYLLTVESDNGKVTRKFIKQ
ncbi:MAG: T9SS type A sorting domain-containing protein, partial [Bacteroidota bacterium]